MNKETYTATLAANKIPKSGYQIPKAAYSIEEFSKLYGISRSMVYLEKSRGQLPFHKVGNRSLILVRDADKWVESLLRVSH